MSLVPYLRGLRRQVPLKAVVLGNPSADLDSICSALSLSVLLSRLKCIPVAPVINIPKSEFRLRLLSRSFLTKVLELCSGEELESLLLFRDSPAVAEALLAPESLDITLVDHNVPSPKDLLPSDAQICRIVDHHVDLKGRECDSIKGWNGGRLHYVPRFPVGSCATLVGALWREVMCQCRVTLPSFTADLRVLLAGTIVQDTFGFREESRGSRWNDLDKEVFDWMNWVQHEGCHLVNIEDLQADFAAISSDVKLHVSLGWDGVLLMDAKTYHYGSTTVTYSSVTIPLPQLLDAFKNESVDVHSELEEFAKRRKSDMIILMSLKRVEKALERHLAVFLPNTVSQEKREQLLEGVTSIQELSLQRLDATKGLHLFAQGNVHYSRKVVEPRIRANLA